VEWFAEIAHTNCHDHPALFYLDEALKESFRYQPPAMHMTYAAGRSARIVSLFFDEVAFAVVGGGRFGSSLTKGRNDGSPGMYFRNALGTTKPSDVWKFSRMQQRVRSVAHKV
jgi:hypothetical protein